MRSIGKLIIQAARKVSVILKIAWEVQPVLLTKYYLTAASAPLITVLMYILFSRLVDLVGATTKEGTLALIVGIIIGRSLLASLRSYLFNTLHTHYYDYLLRNKLQRELMKRFFTKYSLLDVEHLEDAKVQTLAARCFETTPWTINDSIRLVGMFLVPLTDIALASLILGSFHWWIPPLVLLSALPRLKVRVVYGKFLWSMFGSGAADLKKIWYIQGLLKDPSSIIEMRVFGSIQALLDKYDTMLNELFTLYQKPFKAYRKRIRVPILVELAALLLIALFSTRAYLTGEISLGHFLLLLGMIDLMGSSISGFTMLLGQIIEQSNYIDYYTDFMSLPQKIVDSPTAQNLPRHTPPSIEFKNVSFDYGTGRKVLNNISLSIAPGERIALVGVNGAGKSTLIKLLCRFYDVKEGQILINGIDIREIKLSNWHRNIGTLFQSFVRFHFTAKECIELGNPERRDFDQVVRAANLSGAGSFIEQLPLKYHQPLGREFEAGEDLSMGQWQKLAIARAIYQDAPVLIMDEPTSAVDAEAEYEIFKNLEAVCNDKTLIFVSHRFSTVRNASRIYVIDDGRILEEGSHEELMKKNGKYATMFSTQAEGYK